MQFFWSRQLDFQEIQWLNIHIMITSLDHCRKKRKKGEIKLKEDSIIIITTIIILMQH